MKQLFYAAALLAITLAGCTPKSAQDKRIEELTKRYDKFIALTFDDGPSTLTPKILDILEEYDARLHSLLLAIRLTPQPSL